MTIFLVTMLHSQKCSIQFRSYECIDMIYKVIANTISCSCDKTACSKCHHSKLQHPTRKLDALVFLALRQSRFSSLCQPFLVIFIHQKHYLSSIMIKEGIGCLYIAFFIALYLKKIEIAFKTSLDSSLSEES